MVASVRPMYRTARVLMVLFTGLLIPMEVVPAVAQEADTTGGRAAMERLVEAFETGDAHMLLRSATDRLGVSLLGKRASYSRGQALYVMEHFFRQHPPRRFVLDDVRKMDGHRLAMGRYWTQGAEQPFEVYVHLQAGGDGWMLREIRIGGGS